MAVILPMFIIFVVIPVGLAIQWRMERPRRIASNLRYLQEEILAARKMCDDHDASRYEATGKILMRKERLHEQSHEYPTASSHYQK